MTKEEEKSTSGTLLGSKFMRTFLILVTVFLIFAGPTYAVYAFFHLLKLSYVILMISGFALFVVGLVLLFYLIRKGVLK